MIRKFALVLLAVCSAAFAVKSTFKVEAANVPNGTIQFFGNGFASDTTVYAGEQVVVHYAPVTGYVLDQARAFQTDDTTKKVSLQEDSTNYFSFIMPMSDVTLSGAFKKGSYNVAVNGCTLLTCPEASVHEFGSQVTVTITMPSTLKGGYKMGVRGLADSLISTSHQGEDYIYSFAMPGHDVTFTVAESLMVKPTRFKIALNGCENLNCSAPDSANVGDSVTIKILGTESHWPSSLSMDGIVNSDICSKVDNKDTTIYVFKMPSNDVSFTMTSQKQQYRVSLNGGEANGSVSYSGDPLREYGSKVEFSVTPAENYQIDFVKVVKSGDESVTVKTSGSNGVYTYNVPGFDTVIMAGFKKVASASSSSSGNPEGSQDGSSSSIGGEGTSSSSATGSSDEEDNGLYYVNIVKSDSGSIFMGGSFSKQYPNATMEGNEITLRVDPEPGYAMESLSVKTKAGKNVKLTKDGSDYKFKMPASDVTVKATYKVAEYKITVTGCGDLKCVSPETAKLGEEIKVTITLVSGYSGFSLESEGLASLSQKDNGAKTTLTFKMPGNDVKIIVHPQAKPGANSSSSSAGDDSGKSSSSGKSGKNSSSSKSGDKGGENAIHVSSLVPQLSVATVGRQVQVSGARVGAAYALFDVHGRMISSGVAYTPDMTITLPHSGNYMLRVGQSVHAVNAR